MKRYALMLWLVALAFISLSGNEVKVVQAFEMIGGSSVSLARSEWKNYLNPDAKVPMVYSIFRVRIKGNADAVKKAKSSFKLDLGSQLIVKETYTGEDNEIWFLVSAKAKLVYLKCGDGCKECLIWNKQIIPDKVYYGEVEYTVEMEGEYVSRQKAANQWLILSFEPKNAMVEVDGTVVDCGDGIYKKALSCGSHEVRVSAKNYHAKVEKVVIDPSETKKLTISLNPAFGWIDVQGPKDANVFIDNENIGVAPVKSETIASGQHDLRVVKENWLPYHEQVLVNDNAVTTVNPQLVANFATVVLKTGNNGEIWVNGEKRGEGSVSLDLSPGEYTFESRKSAYHSQSIARTITLSSTGTIEIPAPIAITGSLSVDVEPMYAKVYVDDRYIGEAPLIVNDILVGKYVVKAVYPGFEDEKSHVLIEEGKTSEVSLRMNKKIDKPATKVPGIEIVNGELIKVPQNFNGEFVIGNDVTSIGYKAFYECSSLTSVTIPNSVTSIGEFAFAYCSSLTSVTIPNSLTSIGAAAFAYCGSLTSVTIPNSVTRIEEGTFMDCSSLTSVTIPNSVTRIGYKAFAGCSSLTSVTIPNSVTSIGDDAFSGCTGIKEPLFNSTVFAYMPVSFKGEYNIPDGITAIAGYAFYGCSSLTSVTIPNSVTRIEDGTFMDCSSLTSVTIPNSVTSIGYKAFYGCSSLTSVTIPNSVTSIWDWAFSYCSSLTSVTIPNSVTRIEEGTFMDCSSLTSVTIPNSVTRIGNIAFAGCSSLTSVTIPNSVTSIGYWVFDEWKKLKAIYVPKGSKKKFKKKLPIYIWVKIKSISK